MMIDGQHVFLDPSMARKLSKMLADGADSADELGHMLERHPRAVLGLLATGGGLA